MREIGYVYRQVLQTSLAKSHNTVGHYKYHMVGDVKSRRLEWRQCEL